MGRPGLRATTDRPTDPAAARSRTQEGEVGEAVGNGSGRVSFARPGREKRGRDERDVCSGMVGKQGGEGAARGGVGRRRGVEERRETLR